MLTKEEKDFLKKTPTDKKVKIYPFDKRSIKVTEEIIHSIKDIFPDLEVKHMGASALGISGQKDLDIYAFARSADFSKFLPGFAELFGEALHKHETFIEWKFNRDGFDVELYLTSPDSETMKRQMAVFEILKNNNQLLKEYEKLKTSMNGEPFREYQKKKYEFYHKILQRSI